MKKEHPKVEAGAPTALTPLQDREITMQILQEVGIGSIKNLARVVTSGI